MIPLRCDHPPPRSRLCFSASQIGTQSRARIDSNPVPEPKIVHDHVHRTLTPQPTTTRARPSAAARSFGRRIRSPRRRCLIGTGARSRQRWYSCRPPVNVKIHDRPSIAERSRTQVALCDPSVERRKERLQRAMMAPSFRSLGLQHSLQDMGPRHGPRRARGERHVAERARNEMIPQADVVLVNNKPGRA
jgi:hypothetical protein